MQDRSYAIAIVVVIAICCLGVYVAVSGYLNSNPPPLGTGASTPGSLPTPIVFVINTDTPAPSQASATSPAVATSAPVPSPLGAFQTLVAITSTVTPGTAGTPAPKTSAPPPPTAAPPPAAQSCSGFAFCPKPGPADPRLAPTGDPCPRNYIWGRIVDANQRGLTDIQIRFKGPLGNIDKVSSKGAPDPPGIYNILAPAPGGTWIIWVLNSSGGPASPQVTVVAPQTFTGGNCPTRVDFVQQ